MTTWQIVICAVAFVAGMAALGEGIGGIKVTVTINDKPPKTGGAA